MENKNSYGILKAIKTAILVMVIILLGRVAYDTVFATTSFDVEEMDYQYQVVMENANMAKQIACFKIVNDSDTKYKEWQAGNYEPRPGESVEGWKEKRNWDCKNIQIRFDF